MSRSYRQQLVQEQQELETRTEEQMALGTQCAHERKVLLGNVYCEGMSGLAIQR